MSSKKNLKIIALEEHYIDKFFVDEMPIYKNSPPGIVKKLLMSNEERIIDMDAADIDMQILSHNHPGSQVFDQKSTVELAKNINDRLSDRINSDPKRFGGLASLPMNFPDEAAKELERSVLQNGFYGAMIHGTQNGEFFDLVKYWSVFQTASELNKPIYIHPGNPHPKVRDAYYKDYMHDFPIINTAGWGFGVETSTAAVRLILSGIFLKFPKLKIILGHMGEGIPFLLERTHAGFSGRRVEGKPYIDFRATFCENFYITTSGNFSDSALLCSLMELGSDKILFAVDWPYNDSMQGTTWIKNTTLVPHDKSKITHQNAIDLFGIKQQ